MLISCPKCNAVYKVPDNQIPADGKKFKCAECGEIWTVRPQEIIPAAPIAKPQEVSQPVVPTQVKSQIVSPETAQEDDVANMFNRLSQDTKGLFSGKTSAETKAEKIKLKLKLFFSPFMINCLIFLLIIFNTLYISYFNRHEIVGLVPQIEYFYNKLHIESIYKAKNLTFKNVTVNNISRNGEAMAEVSGIVFNQGDLKSKILPIKATLLNKDGSIAAETTKTLTLDRLEPGFSAVFRILLPNSTLEEKTINLEFDENA